MLAAARYYYYYHYYYKCLYVLELTVGFESNLNNNAVHKKEKYLNLIKEMSRNKLQMCEICKSLFELSWRFLR